MDAPYAAVCTHITAYGSKLDQELTGSLRELSESESAIKIRSRNDLAAL